MAHHWNTASARKTARQDTLRGTAPPPPPPLPPSPPVEGGTEDLPVWRIPGVSPLQADVLSGTVPLPPPPPLWPSRDRPQ